MIVKSNNSIEVLKVRLHQHTAVYRNPITSEVIESYPLPPPSTLIGFVHSMLKKLEPDPSSMNIGIQGEYSSLLRDYQWYRKYKEKNNFYTFDTYPILVHTLYDVSLILHFFFPAEYKTMGKDVEILLKVPPYYPYIGRAEDLVKIEDVRWTKCNIETLENGFLKSSTYVPFNAAAEIFNGGVPYKLSGFYKYIPVTAGKETKIIREFEWINLQYLEKGSYFESENPIPIYIDNEGDLIWWSMPNPIP